MFLTIANHLATWARQEAQDDTSKVVFSTIMTLTAGAVAVNATRVTVQNLTVAKNDIANVVNSPANPLRRVA